MRTRARHEPIATLDIDESLEVAARVQKKPRSELLGLRWIDYDDGARTLAVAGKVVRVSGEGLQRVDETKSAAGRRKVPVPQFAVEMLRIRRQMRTKLVVRLGEPVHRGPIVGACR